MTYSLMLAQPSGSGKDPELAIRRLQCSGEWTFEFKYDGIRALAVIDYGAVKIINRNDKDITYRYPEIVEQLRTLPLRCVLDGEIVCLDQQGRPDFSRIHQRDAQTYPKSAASLAATMPATFVAFDMLEYAGVDNRAMPYSRRRVFLTDRTQVLAGAGVVIPPGSPDGETMWRVVQDIGLEGLIAKRNDSRYVGRRSAAWVKIKRVHRLSALVRGYSPGKGSRAKTFGCLHLALLNEKGELVGIGEVGTGFSQAEINLIWGRLQGGDHPIIVEVEYLEVTSNDHLRQPSFKGVRTDLEPVDCSTQQLHVHPKE